MYSSSAPEPTKRWGYRASLAIGTGSPYRVSSGFINTFRYRSYIIRAQVSNTFTENFASRGGSSWNFGLLGGVVKTVGPTKLQFSSSAGIGLVRFCSDIVPCYAGTSRNPNGERRRYYGVLFDAEAFQPIVGPFGVVLYGFTSATRETSTGILVGISIGRK